MKLLILTQKVDRNDPILGFFHRWIEEFSKYFENIVVICLCKGEYSLPDNVKVLSLGKENGESKIKYVLNLYKYIWQERKNYDKVFVHMNQVYIIFAGIIWKLLGKNIYMWRNHHSGSILTDIASSFCKNVFCTSDFSYTAKYKNAIIMPVGVDIDLFRENLLTTRKPKSILSLGRISPSKGLDFLVDTVNDIDKDFSVYIYGDPLPKDREYYENLKKKAGSNIVFKKGITNIETVDIYSQSEIFVNLSSSGMYDKTIFEAMACGCLILASNENLRGRISDDFIFQYGNKDEFIQKIKKLLGYSTEQYEKSKQELLEFSKTHSLSVLFGELSKNIT